jgi:lipoprotein signal peptidase
VIDMIHFVFWEYDYPVFNVADMLIFFGTASLLWGSIRDK